MQGTKRAEHRNSAVGECRANPSVRPATKVRARDANQGRIDLECDYLTGVTDELRDDGREVSRPGADVKHAFARLNGARRETPRMQAG
jgi:hypothetical protein